MNSSTEHPTLRSFPIPPQPLQAACASALLLGWAAHGESAPKANTTTNAPAQLPDVIVRDTADPGFKVDTVSSPKFTQPLLDTPQTVVAVPKEVFRQQSAFTLNDVMRNTPGITFAAGEGSGVASGDSFFMRGTDTSGSVFVDGVRDSGGYSRDVFNVEQVEIFKGPSGADNGRGGSSGFVNLASKVPHVRREYLTDFSYGSADFKRMTADFNQPVPLGEKGDWLQGTALRLNGLWQAGGVAGREVVENSRWGLAPSLALGLGTDTRVFLLASYVEQDNVPDSGLPIVALPQFGNGVDQDWAYTLRNHDFEQVQSTRVTARIERDMSDRLTLRSQTSFTRTDRDALISYLQNSATNAATFPAATTPVNPATGALPPGYTTYDPVTGQLVARRLRNETENQVVFQQLSANAEFQTGFIEHHLGGGGDFTHETQRVPTWSPVGGPPTSLVNPDPQRVATPAQTPYRAANQPYSDATIDTVGGFLFDTLELGRHFQVNASVRLEHYNIAFENLPPATASTPAPTILGLRTDGDLVTWKGGLVYKPVDPGSVYFSYGNSFSPPGTGFNLSATLNNQNNPNLDPQEARNYEVGTKWEFFERRLSTSLALYQTETFNLVSTDAVTQQVTQDIRETVKGVELGLSGQITRQWFVFGGLGYSDGNREAAGTTAAATSDGADLRFLPRWSANLWTAYRLPIGLTIGGGLQYSDSVVRATALNNAATSASIAEVPSFVVFNAMASYDFSKNFSVRLNLNNLFDEAYFRLNNNGGRYYPGVPRSFLLTASLRF